MGSICCLHEKQILELLSYYEVLAYFFLKGKATFKLNLIFIYF